MLVNLKQSVIECSDWLEGLQPSVQEPSVSSSCSAEYYYSTFITLLFAVHYIRLQQFKKACSTLVCKCRLSYGAAAAGVAALALIFQGIGGGFFYFFILFFGRENKYFSPSLLWHLLI